jgi:hypothetical protein
MEQTQQAESFDSVTMQKIAKGAMIAGGSAILTYILQAIMGMDFGAYTPIVVAICGILINTIKSYYQGE